MTTNDFINSFVYRADGKLDSWRDISNSHIGDCDDFAWTVAKLEAGSALKLLISIIMLKTWFYWCRSPNGEAHIIVWIKGKGYIDNLFPTWRDKPDGHTKVIYFPLPLIILKVILGKLSR